MSSTSPWKCSAKARLNGRRTEQRARNSRHSLAFRSGALTAREPRAKLPRRNMSVELELTLREREKRPSVLDLLQTPAVSRASHNLDHCLRLKDGARRTAALGSACRLLARQSADVVLYSPCSWTSRGDEHELAETFVGVAAIACRSWIGRVTPWARRRADRCANEQQRRRTEPSRSPIARTVSAASAACNGASEPCWQQPALEKWTCLSFAGTAETTPPGRPRAGHHHRPRC